MNTLQKVGYSSIAIMSIVAVGGIQQSFAASGSVIDFGESNVDGSLKGQNATVDVVIKEWVTKVLGFMALIAVIYGIYGGFMILTAGGDNEKVKKGKQILINAVIGLLVIFLSYSIVTFVLNTLFSKGA